MRIKWNGSNDARHLAVRGGLIICPPGQWVDVEKEAAATGIPVDHAVIVARNLKDADGWEVDAKSTEKGK